ncbi:magnesium-transporting ATPase (P-type) [Staphylococcus epidermidis]
MNELIARLVGFKTKRDEREKLIIHKAFSNVMSYSFIIINVLLFINLIIDMKNKSLSFGTMSLLFIVLFISIVSIFKLNRKDVNKDKVMTQKEYENLLSNLKIQTVMVIIFFFCMSYMFKILSNLFLNKNIFSLWDIIIYLISGVIFGIVCYLIGKRKIKVEK